MRKILVSLLFVAFILGSTACDDKVSQNVPSDTVIEIPENSQLIAIQCGDKPCIIVFDNTAMAYVAVFPDGSKMAVPFNPYPTPDKSE